MASTKTVEVAVEPRCAQRGIPSRFVPPFYDDRAATSMRMEARIRSDYPGDAQYLLFSYHGIPERHLRKTDPTHAHCLRSRLLHDSVARARDVLSASSARDDGTARATARSCAGPVRLLVSIAVRAAAGSSRLPTWCSTVPFARHHAPRRRVSVVRRRLFGNARGDRHPRRASRFCRRRQVVHLRAVSQRRPALDRGACQRSAA